MSSDVNNKSITRRKYAKKISINHSPFSKNADDPEITQLSEKLNGVK